MESTGKKMVTGEEMVELINSVMIKFRLENPDKNVPCTDPKWVELFEVLIERQKEREKERQNEL